MPYTAWLAGSTGKELNWICSVSEQARLVAQIDAVVLRKRAFYRQYVFMFLFHGNVSMCIAYITKEAGFA